MPDAFDILGLRAGMDLAPSEIQRAYLRRVSEAHPDRRVEGLPGPDDERVAAINAARQVLEDPEQRAALVLARLGAPSKEQDRSLPEGFLMKIMDVREALEAAAAACDEAELERWRAWGEAERERHLHEVGRLLSGARAGDAPGLKRARQELNAWRYIERMLQQLDV